MTELEQLRDEIARQLNGAEGDPVDIADYLVSSIQAATMADVERRIRALGEKENFALYPMREGFCIEFFREQQDYLDPIEGPFFEAPTILEALRLAEEAAGKEMGE